VPSGFSNVRIYFHSTSRLHSNHHMNKSVQDRHPTTKNVTKWESYSIKIFKRLVRFPRKFLHQIYLEDKNKRKHVKKQRVLANSSQTSNVPVVDDKDHSFEGWNRISQYCLWTYSNRIIVKWSPQVIYPWSKTVFISFPPSSHDHRNLNDIKTINTTPSLSPAVRLFLAMNQHDILCHFCLDIVNETIKNALVSSSNCATW